MAPRHTVFLAALATATAAQGCLPHPSAEAAQAESVTPPAAAGPAALPKYAYDPATGRCLDASGTAGLNPLSVPALFGAPPKLAAAVAARTTTAKLSGLTVTGKNAECVDFAAFDLYTYLHPDHATQYSHLDGWNLAGAKLSGCDLRFTNLTGARLAGTDLATARLGYTVIAGTGDRYTRVAEGCSVTPAHEISCFK